MAKVITTELQHSGASSANITLGSSKEVTFNGTVTGDNDTLSFRNLLDNGAMQVNQRGTVANAGNEYGGPDRWKFIKNDGAMTISQDTDVPTGQGFGNSYKIDCTSVAGTSGTYYVHIVQYIEGQDLERIKKGTANAEQLTLSFWIKSTKTGTYVAELYDQDNNRHSSKAYTVSTTNTWEKKTITYAADTTGAFTNDNTAGLRVILWFYAGSSFQGGTLAGTWASNTDANRAEGQVNAFDNTANNVFVTGVQLETGATATEFEHRTYGDELLRCQRYLRVYGGHAAYQRIGIGYFSNNDRIECPLPLAPKMRTTPSMTVSATGHWKAESPSGSGEFTSVGIDGNSSNQVAIVWGDKSGTFTGGESGRYLADNTTDARIYLSAEL